MYKFVITYYIFYTYEKITQVDLQFHVDLYTFIENILLCTWIYK